MPSLVYSSTIFSTRRWPAVCEIRILSVCLSVHLLHLYACQNGWIYQSLIWTSALGHSGSNYLRQGCYVFVVVCLSVCLLATSGKNFRTDLHDIFREGWQWANEQVFKFWWRSRTDSPDGGTDIATLVRRAVAEVCTVPVLLVYVAIICRKQWKIDSLPQITKKRSCVSFIDRHLRWWAWVTLMGLNFFTN